MTTVDFITELFCRIDDEMKETPKHPQSLLYPSEIVTLGVLFAQKGGGSRAFYRWLERDYRLCFPNCPSAHDCSVFLRLIGIGPCTFWLNLDC
ncbi:MAG TPA: hypothetical protein VIJ25_03545 [Methylococcales bacterium]